MLSFSIDKTCSYFRLGNVEGEVGLVGGRSSSVHALVSTVNQCTSSSNLCVAGCAVLLIPITSLSSSFLLATGPFVIVMVIKSSAGCQVQVGEF